MVCISHDKDKTFKRKDGTEYNQIVPTAQSSVNNIVKDMADLYLYAALDEQTKERKLIIRSLDGSIDCGSRFKYMKNEIPLDYDCLIKTLNEAIDMEANETGNQFITNEKVVAAPPQEFDFDALKGEFQELVNTLMSTNQSNATKITAIVSKYLGKGKKVNDCTPDQAEHIDLIVHDLKLLVG